MKFSIGYQLPDRYESIAEIVEEYRARIGSVYFAAPGASSARSAVSEEATQDMLRELRYIHDLGVSTVLLYNANCYGEHARSVAFQEKIVQTVGETRDAVGISDVTTTSPFVAQVIRKHFPEIKITASVNMWIGTTQAMEYLGDLFDGFYMQREYNRDFRKIQELHAWCKAHAKQLKMLANSGCLYTCPFHTFHDNLVAHEKEACHLDNAMGTSPSPCWDLMNRLPPEQAAAVFLQESWVRPEDIARYEPYFQEVKLATRMHSNPGRVVRAYVRGRFVGNMFDLTEPAFSRRFQQSFLDATLFPKDWFERTTNCSKQCDTCGYCLEVAKKALLNKSELEKLYLRNS